MDVRQNNKNIKFDPLSERDEHLRVKFWEKYADDFVSIRGAFSSQSYFKGELELCIKYLRNSQSKGRFIKLDLWNEVHHTPLLDFIWEYYEEIHGVDIAPKLVLRADRILKSKGIPLKAIAGDIRRLPYRDGQFDFVYTMATIEHIPRPVQAMREIYRILKPGGRAIIGAPNKYEWFGKAIVLDILADAGFKEDGRELSYRWCNLCNDLESCGFRIVAKSGLYFMPWFIRLADWFIYQRFPKLECLMFLPIAGCNFLSKFEFLKRHGGLLVAITEKPI